MKTKILSSIVILSIVFFVACNSGPKKETGGNEEPQTESTEVAELQEASFKVFGNCDLCKGRIEKAAIGVDGVQTAEWDKESKILKISHESINIHGVHEAVVAVGHDTEMHKADDAVYKAIPECCYYREGSE